MLHRPQLDGLRALAVAQVLLWHFWPTFPGVAGHRGVQLFFVLSGFLITSILLDGRRAVDSGAAPSRSFALRRFYARRLLRIAPPYYLLLFALALTPSAGVRATFWYQFFYLTNFYYAAVGEWRPWVTAHLWSLATEEQFYLVWPMLILFLPVRWIKTAVITTVIASVVLRAVSISAGMERSVAIWVVPWASFDALGLGALLAVVANSPRRRTLEVAACIAIAAIALDELAMKVGLLEYSESFAYVATEFAWSLAFVGLVSRASIGFEGFVGKVLASKPLVYVGRISYGVYLYHIPVLFYLYWLASKRGLPIPDKGPLTFVIASSVTLIVAAISFRWFERPINELKKRFPPIDIRGAIVGKAGSV